MAKILQYQKRRTAPLQIGDASHPQVSIHLGDSLEKYGEWPTPTTIVSDGPYGLAKFPGEPNNVESLAEWYAPHIAEWGKKASAETTLWFWCSELAWAEVHQVLKLHGWKYRAAHIWDKGIGHVAGNCNGETIRGFPVVTEICVQYVREVQLRDDDGKPCSIKEWLRSEWQRSGLPLYKTNQASSVKNAAARKYFTRGKERIIRKGMQSLHANQKPLELMRRIIGASTDPGDVVWEPFGGLCSATVASLRMGRQCYASELIPEYFDAASERINAIYQELPLYEQKRHS